jgi:hypothetical protein
MTIPENVMHCEAAVAEKRRTSHLDAGPVAVDSAASGSIARRHVEVVAGIARRHVVVAGRMPGETHTGPPVEDIRLGMVLTWDQPA